jgi:Domain of unknown function (DUF5666)
MRRRASQRGTKLSIFAARIGVAALLLALVSLISAQTPAAKTVGTVKSINGNTLVVTPDSGTETTVTISESARILRTSPGQTDLKTATPISPSEIQIGDRVLARGQTSDNGAMLASSVIVMSKSDIAQRQQQEREEWRKGVGGIVKSVDASAGAITLANSLLASGKPIVVHVGQETKILRYAPDSIKFDDAKPGTLDQIKAGDQLRARGTKSTDGTEFAAQGIVSGSFLEMAGTVISTDAASNTFSIMDLATKKPVSVRVGSETQLHKLAAPVAQMIAFRLKGGAAGAQQGQGAATQAPADTGQAAAGQSNSSRHRQGNWGAQGSAREAGERGDPGGTGTGGNWRNGGGGLADFQQMLSRMPAVTIADLNKGDAVMLVATEGSSATEPIAITMLAGVEPILSAAPPGTNAVTLLSPWNLGVGAGTGGDMSTQ